MKDDYNSVFRNLRSTRRFETGAHSTYREPAWLPWVGGFVGGLMFAGLVFLGV